MEPGPLPPHERSWRHPSELAAEERAIAAGDGAGPTTRVFALATGAAGLLAIGVLIIALTPPRGDSAVLVSATTPTAQVTVDATIAGVRGDLPERSPIRAALATPVGDGSLALVTASGSEARVGDTVTVRFASGLTDRGRLIATRGDTVVVRLTEPQPGHALASEAPGEDEIITVMSEPPVTIAWSAFAELSEAGIVEGTPVLDDDGRLVGLCTLSQGELEVAVVSDALVTATSGAP